jgi:hypothetical protein
MTSTDSQDGNGVGGKGAGQVRLWSTIVVGRLFVSQRLAIQVVIGSEVGKHGVI